MRAGGELKNDGRTRPFQCDEPTPLDANAFFLFDPLTQYGPAVGDPFAAGGQLILVDGPAHHLAHVVPKCGGDLLVAAIGSRQQGQTTQLGQHGPRPIGRRARHLADPPQSGGQSRRLGVDHSLRLGFPERRILHLGRGQAASHEVRKPEVQLIQPGGNSPFPLFDSLGLGGRIRRLRFAIFPFLRPGSPLLEPVGDPLRRIGPRHVAGRGGCQQQQPQDVLAGQLAAGAVAAVGQRRKIDADLVNGRALTLAPDGRFVSPRVLPGPLACQLLAGGHPLLVGRHRGDLIDAQLHRGTRPFKLERPRAAIPYGDRLRSSRGL